MTERYQSGRTLWLDPTFGASGDMILGTLVALGGSVEDAQQKLRSLPVDGWEITAETTTRSSITATRVIVTTEEQQHHRPWSEIDHLLVQSSLAEEVIRNSRSTFRLLAETEASIHGVNIDQVHFHEVGAVDAIVDIVGSWILIDQLGVEAVVVGSVGLGHGTVETDHGTLNVPAPATNAILEGVQVHSVDVAAETVTPTGAALLSTMATDWGQIPSGLIVVSGRGAGTRNPETYPNVLTGSLIQPASQSVMLATNLDDVTAEVVGHLLEQLLEAGADDAWVTPIVMKKNRPGYVLNVLTSVETRGQLEQLVFIETQTLGMRSWPVSKSVLPREFHEVRVRGSTVRIKTGPYGFKPEHDDLVAVAKKSGASLQRLAFEARQAYEHSPSDRQADR